MTKAYKNWWIYEGSGMRPSPNEDIEEFAKRITEIAWSNGAFVEREECAKLCETRQEQWKKAGFWGHLDEFHEMAIAIRARNEK